MVAGSPGRETGTQYVLIRIALVLAAALTVAAVIFGVQSTDRRIAAGIQPAADGGHSRGLGPVPSDHGAPLTVDFAALPDGPLPVQIGGRTFRAAAITKDAMPVVEAGQLVHARSTADNSAGYVESILDAPVQRLGVTVSFVEGGGSVALTMWENSLVDSLVGRQGMPNAGVQFIIDNTHWQLTVWDAAAGHSVVLATEPHAGGPAGTPLSFEVRRDGDTATVALSDGGRRVITDPRIAAWSGTSACWQLYEFDAGREPAALTAIWAA
ncbi:hypothetical protein [Nocardia sp. NPDC058497]|uniref:hypothetical protein n=1 Tax=Nocardia sp. NPDC058497 TaxID=3346529 RepID=UPI00364D5905